MSEKTDTALADKVRQFRSNSPKLDMAALSRVKQVADETLFHTDLVKQVPAPEPGTERGLAMAPAAVDTRRVQPIAEVAASGPRRQGLPVALLIANSTDGIDSAAPKSTLSIRIDPDLHMQLKLKALQNRISLGELVTQACREKLAAGA
jgi:HicB family